MDFEELIKKRRSIRSFSSKSVDDELINKLISSATLAPSSGNVQDWVFIIVKDKTKKEKIAKASLNQNFIKEAQVVIVIASDLDLIRSRYSLRGENLYSIQNTANAAMLLILSATNQGLGSCWVGAFDEEEIMQVLELNNNLRPLIIIPIGYPEIIPEKTKRKSLDHVIKNI